MTPEVETPTLNRKEAGIARLGAADGFTGRSDAADILAARARQQRGVAELGLAALRGENLQQLFNRAANDVAEMLGVEYCEILELLPDGSGVLLRSGVGWREGLVGIAIISIGLESQAGYTLLSSRPVIVEDLRIETRFSGPPLLTEHGVVSGVSCIIMGSDGPWGILGAHTKSRRHFTDDDVAYLQATANVLASSIGNRRVQEALRESELRFRTMAEALPNLLWTDLPDGQCDWLSSQWSQYTGIPEKELLGLNWLDRVIHPEDRERTLACWQAACADRAPYDLEYRIRRHDGEYRWFKTRGVPIRDPGGRIIYWFGTCTDIQDLKDAEKRERALTERFRLAALNDAITLYEQDAELRYTWLYPLHPEHKHALGRSDVELLRNEQGIALAQWKREVMESGKPQRREVATNLSVGARVYDLLILPRRNIDGKIVGVAGTALDITRRKQAERTLREIEERFTSILDNSPTVIFIKDTEGRYLQINRKFEELFDVRQALVVGKTDFDIFSKETAQQFLDSDRSVLRTGKPLEVEEIAPQPDGPHTYITMKFPLRREDGTIYAVSGISTDITDKVRAKEELELMVAERTASLREAVAQMEEFSYTVSHDLRAPLRGIHAYSEALLQDFKHLLASQPEAIAYLKRIAFNAAHLDGMVRDVLAFSRMNQGEVHIERVCVDRLVRELVKQYSGPEPANAEFRIEPLADVIGSEPLLAQAISNLLTNALKFIAPNTSPKIRIWTEPRDGEVRLWVQDNGIGIDPKLHHRLFRIFERLHPELNYEGTGVGLAVVRKAAERMNGKVGVESDGVNGCKFWIQLRSPQ